MGKRQNANSMLLTIPSSYSLNQQQKQMIQNAPLKQNYNVREYVAWMP